jgi:peptide-methionine (S)-S-oxide reductase
VEATVGYTGSAAPAPTYKSVCAGDGHTEAVRVVFDPAVLGFDALIGRFVDDPKVRSACASHARAPYRVVGSIGEASVKERQPRRAA